MTTDLVSMARRINDREDTIGLLRKQALDKAADALREVLLQGADLLQVKAKVKYGQWQSWLQQHCSAVSVRMAQRYMRLAAKPELANEFIESGSIREALALLDEPDQPGDGPAKGTKQWPPYLEAMGRLSKLVGYVERFPVEQWPTEGLEKFREDLQPIAAKLWPDKFGS